VRECAKQLQAFNVHGTLTRSAVTIDPSSNNLLDIFVIDACVSKCSFAGFFDHVGVVPVARARLLELGHANADNKHSIHVDAMKCLVLMSCFDCGGSETRDC
jgi:hypothetical protein